MLDIKKIETLEKEIEQEFQNANDIKSLEGIYYKYLGKKGIIADLMGNLKNLPIEEKKIIGPATHKLAKKIQEQQNVQKKSMQAEKEQEKLMNDFYDTLRPLKKPKQLRGHLHPITQIQHEVEEIFRTMGFYITEGPEVELAKYNFDQLNFAPDHPARDMHDTIWLEGKETLLRTHTSCVQVRAMQEFAPPLRVIAPGRCFRYEETDASHENTFHQVEGMVIDKDVSIAHLIHVMKEFISCIFGNDEKNIKIRLRPGYFPFVEPGFELDVYCIFCNGKGCSTCKHSSWIELLPCGLIHPNVLKLNGIDTNEWSGFAFGLGLDRLVMLKEKITDIRYFLSGDLRFLQQF